MISKTPFFTIITPTLNASGTLEETICSALGQGGESEHLIMDGGSADRTLEVARAFPHLTVHSARDKGLYDAMNRGAFFARGEWLIFLQADDWLPVGTLASYREAIAKNPNTEIVTGSAEAVRQVGEDLWETQWRRTGEENKILTVENIALGEPMLNARAIRKSLFRKVGPFDLSYSLASDRDFLLKLAKLQPPALAIEAPTYRYRWHEGSRTMNAGNALSRRLTDENLAIAKRHLAAGWEDSTARRSLKMWHQQESIRGALCAIEALNPVAALQSAFRGTMVNPMWTLTFTNSFLRCFVGWIRRGFRTKSQMRNAD